MILFKKTRYPKNICHISAFQLPLAIVEEHTNASNGKLVFLTQYFSNEVHHLSIWEAVNMLYTAGVEACTHTISLEYGESSFARQPPLLNVLGHNVIRYATAVHPTVVISLNDKTTMGVH